MRQTNKILFPKVSVKAFRLRGGVVTDVCLQVDFKHKYMVEDVNHSQKPGALNTAPYFVPFEIHMGISVLKTLPEQDPHFPHLPILSKHSKQIYICP